MISLLAGLTWKNPVTLKELRIGLREKRIFILQVLFLFLLLSVSLMVLPRMFDHRSSERLAESGRYFFYTLFWIQLLLLSFTMPALTCGSLSGERERNSLDMVLASRLSSAELVAGKLGFAAYCLVLLLFSALPLSAISFFLGGVSLTQALAAYLELFLFGMLAASIGLFCSARESRSNYSTVQAYLLILGGCTLLPFYGVMRFERSAPHLLLGPYFWTLQQTLELSVWHFFVGAAAYFIGFLFLKARHRVRPQAVNLTWMCLAFLGFYAFCLTWLGLYLVQNPAVGPGVDSDVIAMVCLGYVAHWLVPGFFLCPPCLESHQEQQRFESTPFSHALFWLAIVLLGLAVPSLIVLATGSLENSPLPRGGLFAAALLLVYSCNVALARRALLPRWHYSWCYFMGMLILHFIPALGAFSAQGSIWRLHFVSPTLSLVETMEESAHPSEDAYPCLAVQGGLLAVLGPLAWRRSRRPQH